MYYLIGFAFELDLDRTLQQQSLIDSQTGYKSKCLLLYFSLVLYANELFYYIALQSLAL